MEVPVFEFLQTYVNLLEPVNSPVVWVKGDDNNDNNKIQQQKQQ